MNEIKRRTFHDLMVTTLDARWSELTGNTLDRKRAQHVVLTRMDAGEIP